MNVHYKSITGLRKSNEDAHNIILNGKGKYANYKKVNLFGIYDGHGGKEVSTYLSKNLPKYFLNNKVTYPLHSKYIVSVYDDIQKKLKNTSYAYHAGSTCLLMINYYLGKDQYVNIMNTGDCRATLCRDSMAIPLTKDHKPHWPEERARIEKLGGKIIWDGYDYRIKDLSVSRAFGDIDSTPYVTHRPDVFRYKITKNDKFIIMGCDGLWDVINDQDAVNYVLTMCYNMATKQRINKNINISDKLTQYALKKGSTDNVSVIVIFFS